MKVETLEQKAQRLTRERLHHLAVAIVTETERAIQEFGPFASPHEGWAVIREEADELWDEVKANNRSEALREAVQVGAMALRFLFDLVPNEEPVP